MRIIVILSLVFIVGSLASALYFLYHDRGGGTRMVKALTWRVGLSVGLFVLLLAAYRFGFIGSRL